MKRITTLLAITAATIVSAFGQPVINDGGVLNAASYARPGLPNYGVGQGSLFVVFGQRLGPASLAQVGAFPLTASVGGTSIKVTVAGTTVDALMIYSLAGQVAAVMPSNTPVGTGTLTVTYNGQTSATAAVRVVRSAFGTFSVNQAGSGPGIVQNVNSESDRPVNALTKSARPGQVMILWGTGLGPVTGNEAGGPVVGDLGGNVEVYVGGKLANVTYKGRSGCCAGIDQIVFTVPADVDGCYVPVVVKTGDLVSNFTTMSVARSGNACSDPNGITSQDLQTAERNGSFSAG
ncbi:MAG: hypothetical protein H7X89_01415, partial [Rhizobiales bacterium]|nr:hypothetical protein [Hyphomicrobiales bacterium]